VLESELQTRSACQKKEVLTIVTIYTQFIFRAASIRADTRLATDGERQRECDEDAITSSLRQEYLTEEEFITLSIGISGRANFTTV
jgi:hypothetical protein